MASPPINLWRWRGSPASYSEQSRADRFSRTTFWRRAAPFLIVPESVLTLNVRRIAAFRTYLTLLGVAHDVFDILSDVKGGIRSARCVG